MNVLSQKKIGDKANDQRAAELQPQHREDTGGRDPLAKKDRQHLVRGGKKDGKQRAGGDDMPRVKPCRHRGKAALRHKPERAADGRPCLSRARDRPLHAVARLMLQQLHEQVGHEKEGKELERIQRAVC